MAKSDKDEKNNRGFRTFITTILVIALCTLAFAISAAIVVSLNDTGYSLITRITVKVFGLPIKLYAFSFKEVFLVYFGQMRYLYSKLLILYLIPFFVSGAVFIVFTIIFGHIVRAIVNRTSTLHGSSRWATEKELKKAGLLRETGVVLGQTYDAEYKTHHQKKPLRRNFAPGDEGREDYLKARDRYNPSDTYQTIKKKGQIIAENTDAHVLIVGSTRSGKGINTVLPTNFRWTDSIIVMDPKSEAWKISANYRSRFSYTFKFDPTNPKESIHYNPLYGIRRGSNSIADLMNLAHILIPVTEGSKDPYWEEEARRLFQAITGFVLYCMPPEKKNLQSVYSFFSPDVDLEDDQEDFDASDERHEAQREDMNQGNENSDNDPRKKVKEDTLSGIKKHLEKYFLDITEVLKREVLPDEEFDDFRSRFSLSKEKRLELERKYENAIFESDVTALKTIAKDLQYYLEIEDRQLSSVISTLMSKITVIADPNVQEVTSRSDFFFEDFIEGIIGDDKKRHPVSLYLCSELRDLKRLMPLFRLFFEQAVNTLTAEIKGSSKKEKRRFRLMLLMDEFFQLGRMESIERALSISAGYGVLCTMIIQSYDQLKKLYEREAIITDNCYYQTVLRVVEEETSAKIERILDKATKKHYQIQSSGRMYDVTHHSESENISEVGRSLMTSGEIRNMPDDELLIIISGQHPYKAKKIRYYLDDRFNKFIEKNEDGSYVTPALEDNYPHPEALDEEGNFAGFDREGWTALKGLSGVSEYVDNYEEEEVQEEFEEDEILTEDVSPDDNDSSSEDFVPVSEINELDEQSLGNPSYLHIIGRSLES